MEKGVGEQGQCGWLWPGGRVGQGGQHRGHVPTLPPLGGQPCSMAWHSGDPPRAHLPLRGEETEAQGVAAWIETGLPPSRYLRIPPWSGWLPWEACPGGTQ